MAIILKSIDINQVVFENVNAVSTAHMIKPFSMKFEMREFIRENVFPRITYEIIGVHPGVSP